MRAPSTLRRLHPIAAHNTLETVFLARSFPKWLMSRKCSFHVLRCDNSDKSHPVQSTSRHLRLLVDLYRDDTGIVKNDGASYWQTEGSAKEASVTIEFDKPCIIDSFELGETR